MVIDIHLADGSPQRFARAFNTAPPRGGMRIQNIRNFLALNTKTMVELYNSFTEGLPVKKFDTREETILATWPLIRDEVLLGSKQQLTRDEENKLMAEATKDAPAAKVKAAKKTADAKQKKERKAGEETPVVTSVLKLLRRKSGATKKEILEATAEVAKEGYINALLSRILKEKGYTLRADPIENSREKRYHLVGEPAPAPAAAE